MRIVILMLVVSVTFCGCAVRICGGDPSQPLQPSCLRDELRPGDKVQVSSTTGEVYSGRFLRLEKNDEPETVVIILHQRERTDNDGSIIRISTSEIQSVSRSPRYSAPEKVLIIGGFVGVGIGLMILAIALGGGVGGMS